MTTRPTLLVLLREALMARGADGLCNADAECGCGLDDLAPCGEPGLGCEAATKIETADGVGYAPKEPAK